MLWWLAQMVVAAVDTVGVDCNASIAAFVAAVCIGAVGTAAASTRAGAAVSVDFGY
jgi:hypothetical protein